MELMSGARAHLLVNLHQLLGTVSRHWAAGRQDAAAGRCAAWGAGGRAAAIISSAFTDWDQHGSACPSMTHAGS
jgi:hypothetical protein